MSTAVDTINSIESGFDKLLNYFIFRNPDRLNYIFFNQIRDFQNTFI